MNLPRTDTILLSAVPPCFPFQGSFQDTSISPATNVCAHVMEYSALNTKFKAFDHTLSGPFNKLLSVRFSASLTLCTAHFLFLSPLHRFEVLLCYLIIVPSYCACVCLSSTFLLLLAAFGLPLIHQRRFGDGFVGVPFTRAHYALNWAYIISKARSNRTLS